ncbi:MAG: alcohol dehydrogenase catalytic domain-containing protein [Thermodesulfovibrionales bacterium]|nr:alcohol dehydrogenase catalytic domain-containing protein [Thermodesulfovibrionales bacterium]
MKAVVFDDALHLATDHPVPVPASTGGEALIRVSLAGICNTDLEIVHGYMGYKGVLGHEFVGVVEDAPDESLKGKRVVGEINLYCGKCAYCLGGMPSHCPSREVLGIMNRDGAMAEYVRLPIHNLHTVPDEVADMEAVFVEPLAAAFQVLEQVEFMEGDRVLVMGDGKLGLLIALVLKEYTQAEVTLLGHHEYKMEIAGAKGVKTWLSSKGRPDAPYDFVVEATGTAEGFQQALSLLRPRGAVILKSTVAQWAKLNLAPIVINELTVIGSRCGPFAPAIKALAEKKINVCSLISETYPIDEAGEAFAHAQQKGVLKVLLDCQ